MDGEWVGGRDGSWMFCPQTWLLSYPSSGPWETFSRCQSGIHAPSVTIPVAVLILTGERGGEQPLSGLPLPPSHPASTPKQLTESPWLFPMEISPVEPRGGGDLLALQYSSSSSENRDGEGTFEPFTMPDREWDRKTDRRPRTESGLGWKGVRE